MFTQAEFNPRRRTVCYAWIARVGGAGGLWMRPSRLVRFSSSGEYAWDGGHGRISWPEQIFGICNLQLLNDARGNVGQLELSVLPE